MTDPTQGAGEAQELGEDRRRIMRCPFCGHTTRTECIGPIYCGPHQLSDGYFLPARQMVEAPSAEDEPS